MARPTRRRDSAGVAPHHRYAETQGEEGVVAGGTLDHLDQREEDKVFKPRSIRAVQGTPATTPDGRINDANEKTQTTPDLTTPT